MRRTHGDLLTADKPDMFGETVAVTKLEDLFGLKERSHRLCGSLTRKGLSREWHCFSPMLEARVNPAPLPPVNTASNPPKLFTWFRHVGIPLTFPLPVTHFKIKLVRVINGVTWMFLYWLEDIKLCQNKTETLVEM